MIEWAIEWTICGIAILVTWQLGDRLMKLDEQLRIERRLRWQAEMREERAEASRKRITEINWRLINERPMYFGEMPTANMAYIVDGRWMEYHHDN